MKKTISILLAVMILSSCAKKHYVHVGERHEYLAVVLKVKTDKKGNTTIFAKDIVIDNKGRQWQPIGGGRAYRYPFSEVEVGDTVAVANKWAIEPNF